MPEKALHEDLFTVVPVHWNVVPLTDVVDFQEGPGILAKDFHGSGVPLIRLKSIQGRFATLDGADRLDPAMVERRWSHFSLEIGDLLVSTSATIGIVSEVSPAMKGAISYTGIIRMRPKGHTLDRAFLRHFLKSSLFVTQAERMASGSVMRHYGPTHLRQMSIVLPPLREQRAITQILDSLDDKIELNRKMGATLEAMAQALFKSWFVDFDPVRAKAEGRDPGLPAEIAALFPDSFEDSELGEIPAGWTVGIVSKVADVASGKRPPDRYAVKDPEHSVEVWGGNGPMAYTAESLLNEPALLTGRVGTLGSVFRVSKPIWPSDNTLVVKPHEPFFEYAFFVLRGIDYGSLNRGSTQPLLTQGDLKNQKLALPSKAVVSQFSMIVSALFARAESANNESDVLASLRGALLPKLVSGEIRVTDAGRIGEKSA